MISADISAWFLVKTFAEHNKQKLPEIIRGGFSEEITCLKNSIDSFHKTAGNRHENNDNDTSFNWFETSMVQL